MEKSIPVHQGFDPFVGDKLLRFPKQIAEWRETGRTSGPIVVDLDLTNKCPHNCPACPGEWRNARAAEWDTDEVKSVIAQFAEMGAKAISFGGGGDPLAHLHAVEIVEYAVSLGLSPGVITNGAILRQGEAERLCAICKWIRISLDAATGETFARIHGVSERYFPAILDNIGVLASIPGRRATVGVGFLTNAKTRHEIEPAAQLIKSLGADYVQYRPYNFDMCDVSSDISNASAKYGDKGFCVLASWPKYNLMSAAKPAKPYSKCEFHWFATVVNAKGDVHLCCDMRCPAGKIGSLKEEKIGEIWHGDRHALVAAGVELAKCPPLCRGNAGNALLDELSKPKTHEEFL